MNVYSQKAPPSETSHSCGCIGPQNGEPLCPCRMRGVKIVDGRYVQIIDHGPVRGASTDEHSFRALFDAPTHMGVPCIEVDDLKRREGNARSLKP